MSPAGFQERLARSSKIAGSVGANARTSRSAGRLAPDADRRALRHLAFELARSAPADMGDGLVLDWLEDVVKVLDSGEPPEPSSAIARRISARARIALAPSSGYWRCQAHGGCLRLHDHRRPPLSPPCSTPIIAVSLSGHHRQR
jgi:hypothetical protein